VVYKAVIFELPIFPKNNLEKQKLTIKFLGNTENNIRLCFSVAWQFEANKILSFCGTDPASLLQPSLGNKACEERYPFLMNSYTRLCEALAQLLSQPKV